MGSIRLKRSEIGGYAIYLDPAQSAAVANAGRTMLQVSLKGETKIRVQK